MNHKTLATPALCVIVFTGDLYQEAQIFLNHSQNSLGGIDHENEESNFFVSWSGKYMPSSMVSAQLNSFWGKAVGYIQGHKLMPRLVKNQRVRKYMAKRSS